MRAALRVFLIVVSMVTVGGLSALTTLSPAGTAAAADPTTYHYAITLVRRMMGDFPGRESYFVTGETGRFETIIYVPGQGPVDGLTPTFQAYDRLGNPDYSVAMEAHGSGVYWATFAVTSAWDTPGKYAPRLFVGSEEIVPDWQYTLWVNSLNIDARVSTVEPAPGGVLTVTGRLSYVFIEGRTNPYETRFNPSAEIVQAEISAVDGLPPAVTGALKDASGTPVASASTTTYAPAAGFSLTFAIPATAAAGRYTVQLTAEKTNPTGGFNRLTTTQTYGESREVTVYIGTPRETFATGDLREFVVSGPIINTEAGGFPTPLPVMFVATAVGPHSVVWVEFDAARNAPAESIPAEVSTMFRDEFEFKDFPNEVYGTFHGESWNGLFGIPQDVDDEVHVHLLYFNIGLIYPQCPGCFFVGGYFFALGSEINGADLLHMNRFHDAPQVAPSTVAHEFQHMITDNEDSGEPTWTNEGLSDIAIMVTYGIGGVAGHATSYVQNSDVGLTEWGHVIITADYGAAFLFMQYLIDHFDPRVNGVFPATDRADRIITLFVQAEPDSGDGVTAALAAGGFPFTFRDIFENWALANYVDDPAFPTSASEGYAAAYGYTSFRLRSFGPLALQAIHASYPFGPEGSEVEAWGTEYLSLRPNGASGTLNVFLEEFPSAPVAPHSGQHAWWSGDASTDTHFMLQQDFSLIRTTAPRLSFFLYYNTEPGFDFGFVEVSTDGGTTFDPVLVVNGWSGGEFAPFVVDLSRYADQIIRLRFRLTQDTGNGARFTPGLPGLLLDDLEISDGTQVLFSDDMETPDGWETPGGPSPTPPIPTAPWSFYPLSGDTVLVQAVALNGDARQSVVSIEAPADITIGGFGSTVTEVVLAVSSRVDGYPETPFSANASFEYSARILEATVPSVFVARSAAAVVGDSRFPISENSVAPGQQIEMSFAIGVTHAPVDDFELTETAPTSWGPVASAGGADSVTVSADVGTTTIRWHWDRISAESATSASYRATAPATEGSYAFGPASWSFTYSGIAGSGSEPDAFTLTVSRAAERHFLVDASGTAYPIPTKTPTSPVDIELTLRRVSDSGGKVFLEVTAGRIVVHTSGGDDVWVVTGGTATFDARKNEITFKLTTERGDAVILRGPATWDGSGSGTFSIEVWKSKIESRYFVEATGAIVA